MTKLDSIRDKFVQMSTDLSTALIERDEEIDMLLTALLSNEHVLLVGVPGVAKSMLCEAFANWLDRGVYFEWLLSKFSVPEELFGPISVQGLQQDDYRRLTDHKFPQAHFAFLDEIFKASPAILNTMLRVLNERKFANGRGVDACPLQLCLAASNEWPQEQEELGALFDRFLFRKTVKTIQTRQGLDRLFWADNLTPSVTTSITPAQIKTAQDAVSKQKWTDAARNSFAEIVRQLRSEGVFVGDRRMRKAVTACRAFSFLRAADAVENDHLEILSHVLWDEPNEQPAKVEQIVCSIANPIGQKVNGLLAAAEGVLQDVEMSDLASVTTAATKLQDVVKQLKSCGGNGRAERATEYVKGEVHRIKKAAIAAVE